MATGIDENADLSRYAGVFRIAYPDSASCESSLLSYYLCLLYRPYSRALTLAETEDGYDCGRTV